MTTQRPAPGISGPRDVPTAIADAARQTRAYVEMIMGLPFSIHIRGHRDPAAEHAAVRAVWAELRDADEIFSTFRPDSAISRIRRGVLTLPAAPAVVREVLHLADEARRRTAGLFDVHYAGVLDPAGIVKGWAAARAAAHLVLPGADWYLNAGGDVLLRSAATGEPWRVGIENPWDTGSLLTVVVMADGAVATSGRAHRGAHIVNPISRRAEAGIVQATVCGPDLIWADVFATALVASGAPPRGWSLPRGYDCLLVTESGEVLGSTGMTGWIAGPTNDVAADAMRGERMPVSGIAGGGRRS